MSDLEAFKAMLDRAGEAYATDVYRLTTRITPSVGDTFFFFRSETGELIEIS